MKGKKRCHLQHTCICAQAEPPSQELLRAYLAWKEKYVKDNPEYDETAEIHGSYQHVFL